MKKNSPLDTIDRLLAKPTLDNDMRIALQAIRIQMKESMRTREALFAHFKAVQHDLRKQRLQSSDRPKWWKF